MKTTRKEIYYLFYSVCIIIIGINILTSCGKTRLSIPDNSPQILADLLKEPCREYSVGAFRRLPSESAEDIIKWQNIPTAFWFKALSEKSCQAWPVLLFFIEKNKVRNAIPALETLVQSGDPFIKRICTETLLIIDDKRIPAGVIWEEVFRERYNYNDVDGADSYSNERNLLILRKCYNKVITIENKINSFPLSVGKKE